MTTAPGTIPDAPASKAGDDFRLPPRHWLGRLLAIGPGIIVSGSVIGSGELINTPVQAAKFGFVLLWAVIASCVLKCFLQIEIGRHAIVHGRTPFQAFNTLPGWRWRGTHWIGLAYMAGSLLTGLSLAGMMRATAGMLHAFVPLAQASNDSMSAWTFVVFLLVGAILWRGAYDDIEKVIGIMVACFSLSVIIAVALLQQTDARVRAEDIAVGLEFSFGAKSPGLAGMAVVSFMGALGATANELFMYPYWVLEKGYGRYAGTMNSSGWTDRVRGWVSVLRWDVALCTLIATLTTVGYFLLGAAVFHRQGVVPGGDQILNDLSKLYTTSFGIWSKVAFLIGAFCTLFSTLIVAIAAFGRMWADLFVSLDWLPNSPTARRSCHRVVQGVYLVACLAIGLFGGQPPERLVIFAQYVAGLFCTPILIIGICWIARRTDPRVRMGPLGAVCLFLTSLIIIVSLLGSVIWQALA